MKTYGKIFVFAIIGILLSMSLVPGQVAAGDIEVIITQEGDRECVMTTFEGGDMNQEIGQPEGSGMNFEENWFIYTDGPYRNNPSGIAVALYWWTGSGNSADISFDEPVCAVSFYYASFPAVTLEAYNAENNLVATVSGPGNYPGSGLITVWDPLGVEVEENIIAYIKVFGGTYQTYLDNVKSCRITAQEVLIDVRPGNEKNQINIKSNAIIPVAVLSTEDFDATEIDVVTVVFGPDEAPADHFHYFMKDVDKDGVKDAVFHFKTQLCGFSLGDTEATLKGETYDGMNFYGSDDVLIK